MTSLTLLQRPLAGVALLLLLWQAAAAQPVIRCTVDGRTVYQSTPCAGGTGRSLAIEPGPDDAEAEAARQRAQRDLSRAAAIRSAPTPAPVVMASTKPGLPGARANCSQLAAMRDQALNRRNMARNQARQGDGYTAGSAGDLAVGQRESEAQAAEQRLRGSGC